MITLEDLHKACRGHFDLKKLDRKALKRLKNIFISLQYDEPHIFQALDIKFFNMISLQTLPIFLDFKLKEKTNFNTVVKLFLLAQRIPEEELLKIFSEEDLSSYRSMNILFEVEGLWGATVDIFPCLGTYIATDHHFTDRKFSRAVMCLGRDSYTLARGAIRKPVNRTLDLCTGSGVQAILAASHSRSVTGIDINPRAINFAEFNRIFNDVENVTFICGDLFTPVQGQTFDLILVNPPFVPAPQGKSEVFYRDGGETGELILERILASLDGFLTDRGMCQLFTLLLIQKDEDYVHKLYRFLGNGAFDILVLAGNYTPVEVHVIGHLKYRELFTEYRKNMREWLQCHYKNGISEVAEGFIIIARVAGERSPISKLFKYEIPNVPFSEIVEKYLSSLIKTPPEKKLLSLIPVMRKEVKCIWKGFIPGGSETFHVEFCGDGFPVEVEITGDEFEVLNMCDGSRTVREIALMARGSGACREAKSNNQKRFSTAILDLNRKQVVRFETKNTSPASIL